jgi:AcrR family transcriptional regulator
MIRDRRAQAPVRRRDYQSNRRRILAAARRLMAERGLEAITVSEVAHRAGLNRTTAYQHFRTRDELVGALLEELTDEVTDMLVEPRPLGERIDHMAAFLVEHPEIARMTIHQLLSDSPLPRQGWERYVGELRRLASGRKARAGVDAEMLAYVFASVGMLWPLLARVDYEDAEGRRRATERLTRELKRLLLHGVLRPEAWPELAQKVQRRGEAP